MSNTTTTTLNSAMVAALGELSNVQKNATNPHFKSRFATLDVVLDAARPVLAKHGLCLSQEPVFEEGKAGVLTRILHTSGETRESLLLLPLKDQSPTGVGGALTYARRYSASSILMIASEEDLDGSTTTAVTPPKIVKSVTPPKVASGTPPPKIDWAKKVSELMHRDKVSPKDIFRFFEAKGAKVAAESIPDLPVNLLQRVTEVWPDVVEFAFTHMEVSA